MSEIQLKIGGEFATHQLLSFAFIFNSDCIYELKNLAPRFALFCDDVVEKQIGERFLSFLKEHGLDVMLFTFPAGEASKSRAVKAELEDRLLERRFGRDACFIALGGGVTTDLVGFLAATYLRGVALVCIPTTLLGMVDASIGGKTAVNTPFGKNLIGAFYLPQKIFIDLSLLRTLPEQEWRNGFAEVIKYAITRSATLFKALEKSEHRDPLFLDLAIAESIRIKAEVVETDFEEKAGLRRILNFGHTIAHAIEQLENYKLPHGEAVAIGLLVESYLSLKLKTLPGGDFTAISNLVRSFGFKLELSAHVTRAKMLEAMSRDKKAEGAIPRFVQLRRIGEVLAFDGAYCSAVDAATLDETLAWMLAEFGVRA